MSSKLQVKRSAVAGKVPATTDLDLGELAVNTYDGKLFIKKSVSGVESIIEIGSGGGGGTSGASIAISDTAPSSPSTGDLWWDSSVGQLRIYYNDGTSSQWVDAFNSQGLQGAEGPQGPQGPQGNTGAQGVQGPAGVDGKTIRYGSTAPSAGTGNDGDFYINTSNNYIYGPKAAGAWPAGISLVGGGASTGSSVTISDTAPGSPNSGDVWWNSTNGVLYIYYDDGSSSQWVAATGEPGKDGVGVPSGGATGQFLAKASGLDNDTTWVNAVEVTSTAVAGKFNTTTTSPTNTNRLNYEGNLFATSFTGSVAASNVTASGTKDATTFLRGDNSWAIPPGVVSFKETTYVSGSGTFTADPRALFTEVICTGGGGGGGAVDWTSGFAAAGGGGAGGTAITWYTPEQMGATAAYTVGAAGTAGSASTGGNGGNGGSSTFNPIGTGATLTGGGGTGGTGAGNTTNTVVGYIRNGGAGGAASGGDINREGQSGGHGIAFAAASMMGGNGGGSYWGNGGAGAVRSSSGSTAGSNATSDGDGGGGAVNSTNTSGVAGGAGVSGKIFILEYLGA